MHVYTSYMYIIIVISIWLEGREICTVGVKVSDINKCIILFYTVSVFSFSRQMEHLWHAV